MTTKELIFAIGEILYEETELNEQECDEIAEEILDKLEELKALR